MKMMKTTSNRQVAPRALKEAKAEEARKTRRTIFEAEDGEESEDGSEESERKKVDFTDEELQMIADRIDIEVEWGESVYTPENLATFKSILDKLKAVGIEAK